MAAVAARAIIDLAAVALVEPVLGTEAPDRVLHEPWTGKAGLKRRASMLPAIRSRISAQPPGA